MAEAGVGPREEEDSGNVRSPIEVGMNKSSINCSFLEETFNCHVGTVEGLTDGGVSKEDPWKRYKEMKEFYFVYFNYKSTNNNELF